MKSAQTKSFIALIAVLAILSGAVFYLSQNFSTPKIQGIVKKQTSDLQNGINTVANKQADDFSDMTKWKEYNDDGLALKFKYPESWQVTTYDTGDPKYYIVVLDPGKDRDHIRIYVSKKGYFASDGLDKQKTKVAGQEAWNVQDMLFGVKAKSQYFTFDLGSNLELKPAFKTLITTVAIND